MFSSTSEDVTENLNNLDGFEGRITTDIFEKIKIEDAFKSGGLGLGVNFGSQKKHLVHNFRILRMVIISEILNTADMLSRQ